jgi:hypothetical protein
MLRTQLLPVLALALFVGACTPPAAPRQPAPEPDPCLEPVYLELRSEHPDSLSDRAWERLRQLEAGCRAERDRPLQATTGGAQQHHPAAWLWMPAMMVFGGLMWLMMGAF